MILILRKLSNLTLVGVLGILAGANSLQAQESLTLSVTPTLFQMSAVPGQVWQSQIKVANSNSYPLTVYAEPVNLLPSGDQGHSKFVPVFEDITEGSTLAEWIKYDKTIPIIIEPQQSAIIPFSIEVPQDAAPGGHFAAMLVGTKAPKTDEKLLVKTAQLVSSLFFLRIEGDIEENGHIRTFTVADGVVETPQAKFSVTFENRGNVHLQPQGQIKIYNMWGKERGLIPINTQTHFGNVLPQSKRKFEFSWTGESSLADIGRYKAEVGLAYGLEAKKFETGELYFWVIPIKPLLTGLVVISIFIYLIVRFIRAYVRRMLLLAGLDPDHTNLPTSERHLRGKIIYTGDVKLTTFQTITAPVKSGMADLRTRLQGVNKVVSYLAVLFGFILSYRIFFLGLIMIAVSIYSIFWYFTEVTVDQRNYDIKIENPNQPVSLNAEEIILQGLSADPPSVTPTSSALQKFNINIINTSNQPGLSAKTARLLQDYNFTIQSVSADHNRRDRKSVLVYPPGMENSALELSKILKGALLSASVSTNNETIKPTITIYAGEDLIQTTDN